jgi:hypothetical protein
MSEAWLALFRDLTRSFIAAWLVLFKNSGHWSYCAWCGVYDVEVLLVLGCPVLRFAKPLTVDPSDLNSVNRMPSLREAFQLGESLQDSGICNGLGHKVANSGGLCELHCSMDGVL